MGATTGDERGELALALGGGGARGAYQVGFLRHLARRFPDLRVPVLTGVSAGAINAAYLANHTGSFEQKVAGLVDLWGEISVEQVFRVDERSLVGHILRWAGQLLWFGGRRVRQMRGLVDTRPLAQFLCRTLHCVDGDLPGIERNVAAGDLRAVALVATRYDTGQTITFCQGRDIAMWRRPQRVSRMAELRVEHVMASAALPAFFPAVRIAESWYGDGGMRLHSPLAPAIHLGAGRVMAISTRYGRSSEEAERPTFHGYPPPAQVLGVLLNAIFLDLLDQDAQNLERVNALVDELSAEKRGGLRHVDLLVLRPSQDLGALANEYEPRLPGLFRFLTRRLGTKESRNQDLISLVMFQEDYLRRLIEIGEQDAQARADEIAAFVAGAPDGVSGE